jgi:hypothetical protein
MKRILNSPLILLLLIASACFDETDITSVQAESFIKYFNPLPVFAAADAKPITQGYALLGTVKNALGISRICLIRTDEYGNTIDTARYYGDYDVARAYCLQVLSDGGFAILGSVKDPSTNKFVVYFIRTDEVGNPLWTKEIPSAGNVEARHFEVNDQETFIMTGYAEKSNVVSEKQVWIGALDKDGNQPFWSPKMYGADKDDEGRHLQVLGDGSFVITGVTKNDPANAGFNRAFIMKANSTGGAPGIYYLPSDGEEEGNCIRVIDNEHFLISGTVRKASSATGSDIMLKRVSLISFVLTTEWDKPVELDGNDEGRSLILVGSSIYILGTNSTTTENTAISFVITDIGGNNPRYSFFGLGSQLSGSSFERTTFDNGFIISGSNRHSENSISAALIKIRADGSF